MILEAYCIVSDCVGKLPVNLTPRSLFLHLWGASLHTKTCRCTSPFKLSLSLPTPDFVDKDFIVLSWEDFCLPFFLKAKLTQIVHFTHVITSYLSVLHHNTGGGHNALLCLVAALSHPCSRHCTACPHREARTLCIAYKHCCHFSLDTLPLLVAATLCFSPFPSESCPARQCHLHPCSRSQAVTPQAGSARQHLGNGRAGASNSRHACCKPVVWSPAFPGDTSGSSRLAAASPCRSFCPRRAEPGALGLQEGSQRVLPAQPTQEIIP